MIRLEKRPQPSQLAATVTPLLAVLLTMVVGGVMFALLGKPPVEVIRTIFWDPVFGEYAHYFRGQILVKAGPLILIAIGLSIGFRAGIWNIGAEGQYIMGAIFGAGAGLAFFPSDSFLIYPFMIVAGAFGGWLWAMIPAFLRAKLGTNEILVSLMLVYVAEAWLASVSQGLLRNPEGRGFPGSRSFKDFPAANNPELIDGTGMHLGVVAAFIVVILAYVMFSRHISGFNVRLMGEAPRAARFAGVRPARMIFFCLGISGALAGMAGLFEVTGPAGQISIDFNVGYGFTAIIVAFLGRLNPVGILLAGLLMGLTYVGGDAASTFMGLPAASIQLFQGMLLLFLLATDVFTDYRLRFSQGEAA